MNNYLFTSAFLLISMLANSQTVSFGYLSTGAYITDGDVSDLTKLEVTPGSYTVDSFIVGAFIKDFLEEAESNGPFITDAQKRIIKRAEPGTRITVDQISISSKKGGRRTSSVVEPIYYIKDAPVPDTGRDSSGISVHTASELISHPYLYVYPGVANNDYRKYKVLTYKIESVQHDKYYLLKGSGSKLSDEIINFIKNSDRNFLFTDIYAVNNSQKSDTIYFPELQISVLCKNYLYLSKESFTMSSKFDLYGGENHPVPDSISIKVYSQNDPEDFSKADFEFHGDVYPKSFKKYAKNLIPGDVVRFNVYADDRNDKIEVKIVK